MIFLKRFISFMLATAVAATVFGADMRGIEIRKADGETLQIANSTGAVLTFASGDAVLTAPDGTQIAIPITSVVDIAPVDAVATQYSVSYSGTEAQVVNPYALRGVATVIDGAYVSTTNTNEDEELIFALSGSSSNGGYTYTGSYKCTLRFAGLDLMSSRGSAVEVLCGKRTAVEVTGTNTLVDAADGTQKACLYFKGHPEFSGDGTLNLSGNTRHALSSKEYIQLKKSFGTLNVLKAAGGDGIHAGQYFQMNGGNVNIRNTADDGIQVELTDNADDENNGYVIIKGGNIDILCTADGVVVETAASAPAFGPGGGGGGGGGRPGGWDQEDQETSCVACIKADDVCTIAGGTLTLKATGKGGKCIKVDGALNVGAAGTDGPMIIANTTGGVVSGSGENLNGQPKVIKAYGDIEINSGTIAVKATGQGGEGIEGKAYITINGGTVSCETYDDGINCTKKITVNGGVVWAHASNNDGMDCNGSEGFEFNGGVVLASGARSPEESFDCDSYKFVINGGTVIGTAGACSNPTRASQPFKKQSSQSLTGGTWLSLQKQDGTVICSYKVPVTLSSATVLVSSPEFVSGTSYRLVRNSTGVSDPEESHLDGVFTIGGTLTGGTSTNITPTTK